MPNPMIDLILGGVVDDEIEEIFLAAQARRKIVTEQRALALTAGDEFYLQNISPKYLDRVRVRFLKHDGDTIEAVMLESAGSRPQGSFLRLRRTHVGRVIKGGM